MTIQKYIEYTPLTITGELSDYIQKLELTIIEKSGNYLIHKDLMRHISSQRQGTTSTKT